MSDTPNELAKLGADALKDLLTNLTQAKGFVLEQAPDFCQQMIARDMVMPAFLSGVMLALSLAALLFAILAGKRSYRAVANRPHPNVQTGAEVGWGCGCVLACFGAPALLIAAICNAYVALAVYVAPKVFLVEQITRMLK